MDILKLIEKDHKNVKKIIKQLEPLADKPTHEAEKLTQELFIELLLHAKSEEKALYLMCEKENEKFRDFALEGFIEHKLIEDTLKKLLSIKPGGNGEFKALLTVTKELVEHHAEEEEEEEMFPKLRRNFSDEERAEMGQNMLEAKEILRPRIEAMATCSTRSKPSKSRSSKSSLRESEMFQ